MCGVAGYCTRNLDQGDGAYSLIGKMLTSLRHRGPDDEGSDMVRGDEWLIALGSRRLAIQDLSPAGHQPMTDARTGNCLVFNGEIYNFRELRKELEARGRTFRSHTDTEVLLQAYAEWGVGCLQRLRGMFAIALWDAKEHHLLLARDRLGEKPLYYCEQSGNFFFASEIRSLLGSGLIPPKSSIAGVNTYLATGAFQEPHTVLEDVWMLPAGHFALWKRGLLTVHPYWSLDTTENYAESPLSRAEAVRRIREALEDAVRIELISDVPLGAFLSGGIDSSAIVALMSRVSGRSPMTVSITFPEQEYSEASFQRLIAEKYRTKHTEVCLTGEDFLKELPSAIAAMDQPTFDAVNTYVVSSHTRATGLKVALSGLGADELFGGYTSFQTAPRLAALRKYVPGPVAPLVGRAIRTKLQDSDRARKLDRWLRMTDRTEDPYYLVRELFGPEERRRLAPALASETWPPPEATEKNTDWFKHVSVRELSGYMRNVILRDTDTMSMAHGLEVRVPFLDHRLVELILSLPSEFHQSGRRPKALLLDALGPGLPDAIARRGKQGFVLPFATWLRGPLRADVEATLLGTSQADPLSDYLRRDAVAEVWNRFQRGQSSWVRPWALYVLKKWGISHLG